MVNIDNNSSHEVVKGYKAFDKDLKCRNMQYEIGKEYEIPESPIICERGFHFCTCITDVYNYYEVSKNTRVCEVEAYGEIVSGDKNHKFCTNKIRIIREIENPLAETNTGTNNSGAGNAGNDNVGNRNAGYYNVGSNNSGYYNVGSGNSGDYNTGGDNSGDHNLGMLNSGHYNSGFGNVGNYNVGKYNSGSCNTGMCNSGNRNSGNSNSGDWNLGNYNTGVFNTDESLTIKMFDVDSDWTFADWRSSTAHKIMADCPHNYSDFINKYNMSDEEKQEHPEYKTIGGYSKLYIAKDSDKQAWWDKLPDDDKQAIFDLPNFNAEKFKACTGIDVSKN